MNAFSTRSLLRAAAIASTIAMLGAQSGFAIGFFNNQSATVNNFANANATVIKTIGTSTTNNTIQAGGLLQTASVGTSTTTTAVTNVSVGANNSTSVVQF